MRRANGSVIKFGIIFFALVFVQCKNSHEETPEDKASAQKEQLAMKRTIFGATPEGEQVEKFILKNEQGMEVKIITYGGRITSLKVPDKAGNFEDVVLGFDNLEQYVEENPFFGAIIGRYGNRIAEGKFSLDGQEYTLARNNGENHLHGGDKGFDKVVWTVEDTSKENRLVLSYVSEHMEEGYPGRLETLVTYTLNDDNSLDVEYEATTDRKTVVNLTQHSYFNLSGDFSNTILDHKVQINADEFVPVNDSLIPTGELQSVAGTPFDFRQSKSLGKEINAAHEQLLIANGYDHTWVINEQDSGMRFAASAVHPASGRQLEVFTTEPGMQLYTGNFLDGTLPLQYGNGNYEKRTGFCFETQHYPDSPNQKNFPSVVLESGEKYSSKTSFKFSVMK
ncbi:aldose epimerase family protein [Salinimicrobium xinjiangense]|uniref:aldose epimerase family protein n=1 Tax=Salinimicrobium xinjiangense TaxID=438596 RepID=UPI0004222103|nr:aldose epimerase family protein [Salinimicrobium xinjiangense]